MVLTLSNGVEVSSCSPLLLPGRLEHFLSSCSHLRADVEEFNANQAKKVEEKDGLLYVDQHEYALAHPSDPAVRTLGSEDATTCHVLVLRHPRTGVAALGHVDTEEAAAFAVGVIAGQIRSEAERTCAESPGEGRTRPAQEFADKYAEFLREARNVSSESGRYSPESDDCPLEVSLVGGYRDECDHSEPVSLSLLKNLARSEDKFVLKLCCIGSLNTRLEKDATPFPVHYGCAIDLASGLVLPAHFPSHAPATPLRHARCSFAKHRYGDREQPMHRIYAPDTSGRMRIEAFCFQRYNWLRELQSMPASYILQTMSTSPKVEPSHFVTHIRAAMRLVLDHPDPWNSIFHGGQTLVYVRGPQGTWVLEKFKPEQKANADQNRSEPVQTGSCPQCCAEVETTRKK